jgi:hypothetical protein
VYLTPGDPAKVAVAIDSACLWPLSLTPPKNKKHLVLRLFSWTENFLAILLIIAGKPLRYYLNIFVRKVKCVQNIESSIVLMLAWLEDVKQVDVIAEWSMRVLGPALYIGRVGADCVSVLVSKIASATVLAEH